MGIFDVSFEVVRPEVFTFALRAEVLFLIKIASLPLGRPFSNEVL